MTLRRRKKPPRPRTPPPEPGGGAGLLHAGGMRLGHLAGRRLAVRCACGHEGVVAADLLIARHDPATRLRAALAALRCSRCGAGTIRSARLLP